MLSRLLSPDRLLGAMPPDVRAVAGAAAEMGAAVDLIGLPDPPPAFAELFEQEAARAGVPKELLAAVSGVLAGYRPDAREEGRAGLMGFPGAGADRVVSIHGIATGDPDSLDAVRLAVREAAERLADLRGRGGGLGTAIAEYVAGGVCGVMGRAEKDECRKNTAAILGAFMAFVARKIPAERWGLIREMLS